MLSSSRRYWLLLFLWQCLQQQLCSGTSLPVVQRDRKPFPAWPLKTPLSQTQSADPTLERNAKQSIATVLEGLGRATKQIGVHFAFTPAASPTAALQIMAAPRLLCLSGVVGYAAGRYSYNRSEAAQRACYFWKRAGPIVAHYKFTQWWLTATKAPLEKRHDVWKSLHDRYCEPSLDLIRNLKGLYVKIGQVMSSRGDFLPPQYVKLFATVQDQLPQWPIEDAMAIVKESLRNEWGLEYQDVFESIESEALGSASIGQVHRAVLKDPWVNADPNYSGGRTVAIKIMHPDAKRRFACDFQVFKWLCRVAMPGWEPFLNELIKRLMNEFDYRNEANSLSLVRDNLDKSPYRKLVKVPQPYKKLCCQHLLVMEMLEGKKLIDAIEDKLATVLGGDKKKAHELLAQKQKEVLFGDGPGSPKKESMVELFNLHGFGGMLRAMRGLAMYRKMNQYVDLLIDVHGHQIFVDATFNGDPHAGNIMELSDGRLGLIDFGQTSILKDEDRLRIAQVVVDVGRGADSHKIAESMRRAGFRAKGDRDEALAQYATLFFDSDFKFRELGYPTPQDYFAELMETDTLVEIPDAAIMVTRVSLLFRGAGTILNRQVQTSQHWQKHAGQALLQSQS